MHAKSCAFRPPEWSCKSFARGKLFVFELNQIFVVRQYPDVRVAGHAFLSIGATSEPNIIGPAKLLPGRFDTKILVGPPEASDRAKLLNIALRDKPVNPYLAHFPQ